MSDEQSWNTMGNTGNRAAQTPHLDRLSEEATSFDGCYTPYPLCCPSRTSLMTGLMPRHHGVLGNWRSIEPWLRGTGLAKAFTDAGYHTMYTGKWHVPGTTPQEMGWAASSGIPAVIGGQDRGRYIEPYREFARGHGHTFDPDHIENLTAAELETLRERPYGTSSVPLEDFLETWQTDTFLQTFEQRPPDSPWLAFCSYNAPHFPLLVPAPYDRLIDRDLVELPASLTSGHADKPQEVRDSHVARDVEVLTRQDWLEATAHYLGLVALVDAQVGRIREHLERAGEWDNTIVVFTSDHGDMMGAHGLMEKGHWLHYEEDLRVPLIIRAPDAGHTRTGNLMSVCDVASTLCDLAGVPWQATDDGISFAHMVGHAQPPPTREHVFAETMLCDGRPGGNGDAFHAADWQFPRDSLNASVRTRSHRYVFRSHDEDELYDLVADPHEQVNIVASPQAGDLAEQLRGLLAAEVGDVLPTAAALIRDSSRSLETAPSTLSASKGAKE